jgi:hypothetical protein
MIHAGVLDNPPLSRSDYLMAAWTLRREFTHNATVGDSLVNDNRAAVLCCLPRRSSTGAAGRPSPLLVQSAIVEQRPHKRRVRGRGRARSSMPECRRSGDGGHGGAELGAPTRGLPSGGHECARPVSRVRSSHMMRDYLSSGLLTRTTEFTDIQ